MLYPCIKCQRNRTICYGDIAFQRFGGYRSAITNAVWVLIWVLICINNLCYVADTSPLYHIIKQSDNIITYGDTRTQLF